MENCESKKSSRPFKIQNDDTLGRYLIATRRIHSGEILIKEKPLISGPPQLTAPVCLGVCGQVLRPPALLPCELCGWPMCGAELCKTSPLHEAECFFTRKRGDKIKISNFIYPHPNYQCITALRILFQRDNNKKLWDKIRKLEAHTSKRKGTEKYDEDRRTIVEFIHRFFKLETMFTEEDILEVCGILQVNGHEIPLSDPPYVAIYEEASMLEHNCRANCCKSFTANGEIVIHAAVDMQPGEHLSICYTDSLWGTPNRRHYLMETKFFSCTCERCNDPTEFNTWFSALKCNKTGCSGNLLPQTFLQDPKTWKCFTCTNNITSNQAEKILERIGCDLSAMKKGDQKSCKLFIEYYEKHLHPNHYYLTDVRLALAQLIAENVDVATDAELEEKIKICAKLIDLLEIISPAELRVRGLLLFEMHAAIAENAKRRSKHVGASPYEFQDLLIRSRGALAQAVDLLQHEPAELAEGQILMQGRINLKNIDEVLRKLHENLGDTPI